MRATPLLSVVAPRAILNFFSAKASPLRLHQRGADGPDSIFGQPYLTDVSLRPP